MNFIGSQRNSENSTLFSGKKIHTKIYLEKIKKNQSKLSQYDFQNAKAYRNASKGPIKFYAVNSLQGLKKKQNQDWVSIHLNQNIQIKDEKIQWQLLSIFDGHGGVFCSNFLKKFLHDWIIDNLKKHGKIIMAIE